MTRCFIVGCPRSGTTLLQALLGSHSKVFTLPESHFFRKSFRGKRAFFLRGFRASQVLREWLESINMTEHCIIKWVPRFSFRRQPVVDAFVRIMDELALSNNCICWVEKTPGHVFVVDKIEATVPGALFIHVIRDGRAVVASLMDARRRFPEAKVWQHSLEDFVQLWNAAILESAKCVGRDNHYFISYEALTRDPRRELLAVCSFLGLEFEESMLVSYREHGQKIIRSKWHWVKNVANPIQPTGLKKYESILTDNERRYIEQHLIKIPEALRRAMEHG